MPTTKDNKFATSARAHIEAAEAAPHRAELELQQAAADANQISDKNIRETIKIEIRQAVG